MLQGKKKSDQDFQLTFVRVQFCEISQGKFGIH